MAAAQEFSSPGEHMKSIESGSSSAGNLVAGTIGSQGPPVNYDNVNNSFREYEDEQGYFNSARSFSNSVRRFNKEYIDYNDRLFNSAMEYDKYMSNTAIQRQVADLKAAGLNPILGAYLGGATYKGVNAPYISISPASALQAFTQNEASHYASDSSRLSNWETTKIQIASNEFIAQYNKTMDRVLKNDQFVYDSSLTNLKRDCDRYLDSMKHLDDKDLENTIFRNKEHLYSYQKEVDDSYLRIRQFGFGTNREGIHRAIYSFISNVSRLLPGAKGFLIE